MRNKDGDIVQTAESRESVAVLKAKFLCNPLTNVIIERQKFNTRFQEALEPVQNFITALKILADACEIRTLKKTLIRDRIVCGVSSDALRKQLLKERDLTLHKAVQLNASDNRPALPQSLTKQACTVEVVMHRRRNSAQHLPKMSFVHENASFRQSAGQHGNAA